MSTSKHTASAEKQTTRKSSSARRGPQEIISPIKHAKRSKALPSGLTLIDSKPRRANARPAYRVIHDIDIEKLAKEQGVKPFDQKTFGAGSDLWKDDEEFEEFMRSIGRPVGGRS